MSDAPKNADAPKDEAAEQRVAALEADARRYQQLLNDPETGRHLLLLLSLNRGDEASFRRMQDRIEASKLAALSPGQPEPTMDGGA